VSFLLENSRTFSSARDHNAVLTRNPQTGQYILSYGGVNTNGETRTVKGSTLEALSSAMTASGDFSKAAIDTVRRAAGEIPAVVFAKAGVTEEVLGTLKNVITKFYIEPTAANYETVKNIYKAFLDNERESFLDRFCGDIRLACGQSLTSLSEPLAQKIFSDTKNQTTATSVPRSFSDALQKASKR